MNGKHMKRLMKVKVGENLIPDKKKSSNFVVKNLLTQSLFEHDL